MFVADEEVDVPLQEPAQEQHVFLHLPEQLSDQPIISVLPFSNIPIISILPFSNIHLHTIFPFLPFHHIPYPPIHLKRINHQRNYLLLDQHLQLDDVGDREKSVRKKLVEGEGILGLVEGCCNGTLVRWYG